jgi:hypothetical protein
MFDWLLRRLRRKKAPTTISQPILPHPKNAPGPFYVVGHDGLGHISIQVNLRSGHMPADWTVRATVMAEAGQLEDIARRAALFFGQAE